MKFSKRNRYKDAILCPCGKSNKDGKFVPFIMDGTTSTKFGYCHSCGKTFLPNRINTYKDFSFNKNLVPTINKSVPIQEMNKTLINNGQNNFIIWLKNKFPTDYSKAINKYKVGTFNSSSTLFWYISINEKICTAKKIQYNSKTGKRIKDVPIYNLYSQENGYSTCLFGEHILKDNYRTVALVESEKTAVVGSILFPNYVWLATGGANGLTFYKAKVLKSRNIIYIPDCDNAGKSSIEKVSSIFKKLNVNFRVFDSFFENYNNGEDIVDLLF